MKSIQNLSIPIIQGGMGVGVSGGRLAGSVAREGAMGTIAGVALGYNQPDFYKNTKEANLRMLRHEIEKAKQLSEGNGLIAVNIMVATTEFDTLCRAAAECGADAILSGAGLPLDLPALVEGYDILLAPIISSQKALKIILRHWQKKYRRLPDFVVIEGPKAGGHLGFKPEDVDTPLDGILIECVEYLKSLSLSIPLFVGGGVNDAEKLNYYRSLGAYGAQIGTRFILTEECDAHINFKKKLCESTDDDVGLLHSPVGLPGRAVKNAFFEKSKEGRIPPKRCVDCLKTCNPATTRFCICEKLINAVRGDVEDGLVFCSAEISKWNKITTVKEVLKECWQPE